MKTCAAVLLSGLTVLATLVALTGASLAAAPGQAGFPTSPHPELTPGSLCESPTAKRYPEGIPYCARKVASELKAEIMREYDQTLGYRIQAMNRGAFKIDHYIPLCMGGSNRPDNLWPQHESVFNVTDPLEGLACDKMAQGKLRQAAAVSIIREAKANLGGVPALVSRVQQL